MEKLPIVDVIKKYRSEYRALKPVHSKAIGNKV
jgi:hypothetical protein